MTKYPLQEMSEYNEVPKKNIEIWSMVHDKTRKLQES